MAKFSVGDRVLVLPNNDCTDHKLTGLCVTVTEDPREWKGVCYIELDSVDESPYPPMTRFGVAEKILKLINRVPVFSSSEECEQWLDAQVDSE